MKLQNSYSRRTVPALLIALALGYFPLVLTAQAANQPSIVGLWNVHYFYRTHELFQSYDQWHSDGLEFEVAGSSSPGSVCQGTWKVAPDGTIQLFHVAWTFDDTGALNGYWQETQQNTLSADCSSYQGNFRIQYYDLSGNFLSQFSGTLTATRLPTGY
jgi:hypothetical protein